MLDSDPEPMNPDPQHWVTVTYDTGTLLHKPPFAALSCLDTEESSAWKQIGWTSRLLAMITLKR
jgi:hypothetical protein